MRLSVLLLSLFAMFTSPGFSANDDTDCSSKSDSRLAAACHDGRGLRLGTQQNYDDAISEFNQAIQLFDDPSYRAHRAVVWSSKGEFERAMADYDHALKVDPQNASVYFARAGTWLAKKDLLRAKSDLNKAMSIDPRNSEGYQRVFEEMYRKILGH
jgi:tetratricopeptide (TPR) repeat protein